MVKTETEALPPDWPEGAFVKEEETPPAWPEGAIVKEEIQEEPPMWPEGAVVKQEQQVLQEQQELARAGPQDGATPMQQCGGHGCELARFHEGLCTSHSLAKATQQKRAAPPSEDSDGVERESEEDEEAGVAEEGQNGATPTGQRVGTVASIRTCRRGRRRRTRSSSTCTSSWGPVGARSCSGCRGGTCPQSGTAGRG